MANLRAKGHHKIWLKEDGPKGDRAVGNGFRAFHFERLAARLPVTCAVEILERSAGLTAHNLLLRGGEVGERDYNKVSDPNRIFSWLSIEWRSPCRESAGRLWNTISHALYLLRIHTGPSPSHPTLALA